MQELLTDETRLDKVRALAPIAEALVTVNCRTPGSEFHHRSDEEHQRQRER